MTTLQEALPCPFCGSTHVGHTKLDYREFVICNRCGAGADSADTAPEKTALEVWNTRTALAQQGAPVAEIMLDPETMGRYVQYTLPLTLLPIGAKLYIAAPAPRAQEPHGTQQLRERIANTEPANSYDLAKRADNGGQP